MDGAQLTLGHFEEVVYLITLSSQKFLVLILSTLEEWKSGASKGWKSTLEPHNLDPPSPAPLPLAFLKGGE